jgi:hypothetical protein
VLVLVGKDPQLVVVVVVVLKQVLVLLGDRLLMPMLMGRWLQLAVLQYFSLVMH